jgi:general secretion pathway protein C
MSASLKLPAALSQFSGMNAAQWAQLGSQRAPQLVTGLAVLGIAWQAAKLTWLLLMPAASNQGAVLPAPVPTTTQPTTAQANVQLIADAHLFGIASANNTGLTDPNNLPQSQTSLVLAGTMALDDPQAGFAIVGENAASAKFYRVGATLNGNVRLHSVYADRVIIDRNGVLETLLLPRGAPSTAPAPVIRASTASIGDNLRRVVASNPGALGELLRAQPVFSNGVQKGYRVYPGRDRQQFTRLGLQPGDLVTSINGSTLDDANRGAEILATLTSSTSAQITVERNGVNQSLTLDMSQLNLPDSSTDTSTASSEGSSTSNAGPRGGFNGPPPNRGVRSGRTTANNASTQ